MIGLSQSALSTFRECPACFWWEKVGKVARPRSPFPSICNALDGVMKEHMERLVKTDALIDALIDIPGAKPFRDRERLNTMRSWRTFQAVINVGGRDVKIWGELDDLIEKVGGLVSPWDYKTKGDEPDLAYCEKWYQFQLDFYDALLGAQNYMPDGKGYITCAWPKIVGAAGNRHMEILFQQKTIEMTTDPARVLQVISAAAACLEGPEPDKTPGCAWCEYGDKRGGAVVAKRER